MKLNICEFRNITLKVKKSAGGFFYNAWIAGRYFWIGIWDRLQINAILSLLNTKFKVIIQNGLRIFWAIYIDLCPMPTLGAMSAVLFRYYKFSGYPKYLTKNDHR